MGNNEPVYGKEYNAAWLKQETIDLFIDSIAGKLYHRGMRTISWDIKKCEAILTETVLPTRLIRILNQHSFKVFNKLKEYENSNPDSY